MKDVVPQAVSEIQKHWSENAKVALVLGTGLGTFVRQVQIEAEISFHTIPGFPTATALSHRGRLVCGRLHGVPLMLLDGRCHLYEGYSFDEVTLPIRVMHACGARLLIVSNASGGLNPRFQSGDVMVIEDHISLLGNPGRLPFPIVEEPTVPVPLSHQPNRHCYDRSLISKSLEICRRENFPAHQGVYVAVTGPNYETRAEYRFLRRIGGDAVGMSTVPEALLASELGMRTLGLSIVTNTACPDAPHTVDPNDVVDAAESAEPRLRHIVTTLVASERASSTTGLL